MFTKLTVFALIALGQTGRPAESTLVDTSALQAAGLEVFWEAHLPLPSGDRVENAFLVDEAIYVTTDLGSIFAIKADVGLIRWAEHLTEPDFRVFKPTHVIQANGQGPVVIPTTTATFVYDRYTGKRLDRFTPPFATGGPAVAYNNNLFMGSIGGRFYAMIFNHPSLKQPIKKWDVLMSGPITAAPVLYDRHNLIIASQGGVIVSCFAEDKTFNWSYRPGGPITGDPVVDASGVYVASLNRSLYKLNKSLGLPLWQARFPRPLYEGPVVADDLVYQFCETDGLSALDAASGTKRWTRSNGRMFAAHNDAGDVIFTSANTLDVVDVQTGDVRSSIAAPEVLKVISNDLDSSVYAIGADGRLLCARLDTVPYLRRQQILSARNQLNQPPIDKSKLARPKVERTEHVDPLENDPLRSRRDLEPK